MQLSSGSLCVCSAGSSTRESPVLSVVNISVQSCGRGLGTALETSHWCPL